MKATDRIRRSSRQTAALLLFAAALAPAQQQPSTQQSQVGVTSLQTEDLRKQLEALKSEYEQKLRDLEQRIDALEKQGSSPAAPPQSAAQEGTLKSVSSQVGKAKPCKTVLKPP
jgi:hypothetical protein